MQQIWSASSAAFSRCCKETYGARPELCREVAGAVLALARAQHLPDTTVAIATAGWLTTAKLKLSIAGFEIGEIAIATSNDAASKVDIMRVAHDRARARASVSRFASVTYIGDSAWDRHSAAELGFDFIGIDTSGFVSDHDPCFADFSDWDGFSDRVLAKRREGGDAG